MTLDEAVALRDTSKPEWTGITIKNGRWRATVRGTGNLRPSQSFPFDTSTDTMQAWRAAALATMRAQKAAPPVVLFDGRAFKPGTLGADVAAYLDDPIRRVQPSQPTRAGILLAWLYELGASRKTASVTTAEVTAILRRWSVEPRAPRRPGHAHGAAPWSMRNAGRAQPTGILGPATVRHRRSALQAFYTALDPARQVANPVRDAWSPRDPKLEDRGLNYETLGTILDAMRTEHRRCPMKDRHFIACCNVRARVMALTGVPAKLIGQIIPSDLHLDDVEPTLRVVERIKGAGVEARTQPLMDEAVDALRDFAALDAFGPFDEQVINKRFQAAAASVGIVGVTMYDLRHSFGTYAYLKSKCLATTARLMGHGKDSTKTTARYCGAAFRAVDTSAVRTMSAGMPDRFKRREPARRFGEHDGFIANTTPARKRA